MVPKAASCGEPLFMNTSHAQASSNILSLGILKFTFIQRSCLQTLTLCAVALLRLKGEFLQSNCAIWFSVTAVHFVQPNLIGLDSHPMRNATHNSANALIDAPSAMPFANGY